jgi:hypothetical protein
MTFAQLLLDGFFGALFAAACLASLPNFQPMRQGWLPRFGWFLIRYALPLTSMLAVTSWFVLKR